MNKARLEAFSDGVFAIVITLLILNVKEPHLSAPVTDAALWQQIGLLLPSIVMYAVTFAVVSMLWINHHFLFHSFAKAVNRQLNLLNLLYLMFVVLLPFSANLFGLYITHQPAAFIYGVNILIISIVSMLIVGYVRRTPEIYNHELSKRTLKQARVRNGISVGFALLGMLATLWFIPLAVFLYAFPVIFNIIPGTLNFSERLFGFTID